MSYRFRIVQHSTKEVKDGWLGQITLKKIEGGESTSLVRNFVIKATQNPKEVLVAETASQAFFMYLAMDEKLKKEMDVQLVIEEIPSQEDPNSAKEPDIE